MLAATGPLHWQAHPEVWLLVVAVVGLGFYVTRVIQPKVVAAGTGAAVTTKQRWFFAAGVVVLFAASDWPIHDVAEEYLYSIHMVQHLLLTYLMPPLFLLAMPGWLLELILGTGRVGRGIRTLCRPIVAGVLFNALVIVTHAAPLVNLSVRVAPVHYVVHVVLVLAAFVMWMPVCGPVPELRMTLPVQMAYLFLMSVLPTIPAAFLTVAENPLYQAYNKSYRMWGVSVVQDQQAAGLIMKLGGGFYLWTIIGVLFFKWAGRHVEAERANITVTERDVLTFEHVRAEFDRTPAATVPSTTSGEEPIRPEAAN